MARFYKSPKWRHILTTRDSVQTSTLDNLASNRRGRFELGGPCLIEGFVPSDDPRVNILHDDDFPIAEFDPFYFDDAGDFDYPQLAEGVRMLASFRREGVSASSEDPWVIRHHGLIMETEDVADTDRRLTRFTAFDPWAYLYLRPCRLADGSLPDENGVNFPDGISGDQVILELLLRTITEDGPVHIDAGVAWGGTSDFAGTLQSTDAFFTAHPDDPAVNFPRGTSVGQAWEQMVDTGTVDIVLTPIWDPFNRPGYAADLNIYRYAGGDPRSITITDYPTFAWDRSGRAITRISRQMEGRDRANRLRFYGGQGGIQSGPPLGTLEDAESVQRFGVYFGEEALTRRTNNVTLAGLAQSAFIRRRAYQQFWRMSPASEFAPRPFNDYYVGSFLAFYHSQKLREEQWWIPNSVDQQRVYPRVSAFDVRLSDDALEEVDLEILIEKPWGEIS